MDLATLLQEVCQLHREMVPGAHIAERIATAPMRMVGDPKLLFQVFSNLLSNAIKYSPDGGVIAVDAALAADEVVVTIADHGIGIPASDLDRLFERYHRGSNVSGIVGTGVGLYLVKMVVDLHGGAVAVESTGRRGLAFHHPPAAQARCRSGDDGDRGSPVDCRSARCLAVCPVARQ